MRIHAQLLPQRQQIAELIGSSSIAMLTTLDDENNLVSRPMAPLEYDVDGTLWFFTDDRSEKLKHLALVNVSFSDEDNAMYVSMSGYGEVSKSPERIKELWTVFAKPWFPEGPDSPHISLLRFVPKTAEIWDAPNSKMVRLFAMVVSAVASHPIGLGENTKLGNV